MTKVLRKNCTSVAGNKSNLVFSCGAIEVDKPSKSLYMMLTLFEFTHNKRMLGWGMVHFNDLVIGEKTVVEEKGVTHDIFKIKMKKKVQR